MIIRIGYIPYLNMAPFHRGFGPEAVDHGDFRFEFRLMSPRVLGLEAEKGTIDAGAMSLVDTFRLSNDFEAIGPYGIGLKRDAQSVLVFSKKPLRALEGMIAVTDETSTSVRLLQVILESRYGRTGLHYGRIASSVLFDGDAEALLLIGDEALRARRDGIRGFPVVTDLGQEWYQWQKKPFVFARWVVRKSINREAKALIKQSINTSLLSNILATNDDRTYWDGFAYELTPDHEKSIELFAGLLEKACLTR